MKLATYCHAALLCPSGTGSQQISSLSPEDPTMLALYNRQMHSCDTAHGVACPYHRRQPLRQDPCRGY